MRDLDRLITILGTANPNVFGPAHAADCHQAAEELRLMQEALEACPDRIRADLVEAKRMIGGVRQAEVTVSDGTLDDWMDMPVLGPGLKLGGQPA